MMMQRDISELEKVFDSEKNKMMQNTAAVVQSIITEVTTVSTSLLCFLPIYLAILYQFYAKFLRSSNIYGSEAWARHTDLNILNMSLDYLNQWHEADQGKHVLI